MSFLSLIFYQWHEISKIKKPAKKRGWNQYHKTEMKAIMIKKQNPFISKRFWEMIFWNFLWSCGGSNPGPNKEAICFLHAYPFVDFCAGCGKRHPNPALALWVSRFWQRACRQPVSIYLRLRFGPLQDIAPGRRLVPAPWAGIMLIYYTSIKLQERN